VLSAVFGLLITITGAFSIVLGRDLYKHKEEFSAVNPLFFVGTGFITNFFDALGIGSFAQLAALFKFFKLVPDRIIPGTLNVSCCLPVILEALIFMTIIEVDPITLIAMIAAATAGSFVGAGLVSRLPEKKVQLYMGIALLIVAVLILSGLLNIMPVGGDAIALSGSALLFGIGGNFILGALMTIGIGLFAPCMALVYLLGLSPRVAFPIMMGSCAFLQPVASCKFISAGAYDRKASLWISLTGSAGVLIAAYIVKALPLTTLKWVVVGIIIYTGLKMMYDSFKANDCSVQNSCVEKKGDFARVE
jgi:uncharacterized membrane protein YfcA